MAIPGIGSLPAMSPDLARLQAAAKSGGESFQDALASASTDAPKIAKAAREFESLIMGTVLKTARESSDGSWLGTGENDQAGELAVEMAEQQFAQALSVRGGLGIAKLVTRNLRRD